MGYVLVVIKSGLFFGCVSPGNVIDPHPACLCVVLDAKHVRTMTMLMSKSAFLSNPKDALIILIPNNQTQSQNLAPPC